MLESALIHIRKQTLQRVLKTEIAERIVRGDARREDYGKYLLDVYNYAQHSPRVISLAGSRCTTSHPALAAYLFRHASEELGHEEWASADLQKLGFQVSEIRASRPSPFCAAMIGLEYYVAGFGNPVALFGWLYTLESLGDDIAHSIASRVAGTLPGKEGQAIYFLRGHGDADHDHAKEIEAHILTHIVNPSDRDDMLHIARLSADFYVGILNETTRQG